MVASKKTDKDWLNEVNSQSLLASLNNLDNAFSNFFKRLAKFPRYKKKYSVCQSFQCPQHVTVDIERCVINLPKIKGIKAKLHRCFSGKIKTVTIKRTPSGKYFASVLVDDSFAAPLPTVIESEHTVGLDVGLEHFLIDSEGDKKENPRSVLANFSQAQSGAIAAVISCPPCRFLYANGLARSATRSMIGTSTQQKIFEIWV
jgi:putative transposase